ncbi:hypothetical protein GCM10009849_28780 [Sinomonas flava]|uniref:Uncharacterized protein n=1 Tax=Sinomonas flava TaxID=496857 RepID=A0ABP5NUR8_9MICC
MVRAATLSGSSAAGAVPAGGAVAGVVPAAVGDGVPREDDGGALAGVGPAADVGEPGAEAGEGLGEGGAGDAGDEDADGGADGAGPACGKQPEIGSAASRPRRASARRRFPMGAPFVTGWPRRGRAPAAG